MTGVCILTDAVSFLNLEGAQAVLVIAFAGLTTLRGRYSIEVTAGD